MIGQDVSRGVRRLAILGRRAVVELSPGWARAIGRGRGLAFAQVRAYQPGDDVRDIDWNVTARRGEPFVKEFAREREQTIWLLVDESASMDFGSTVRTKRDLAVESAAVLALAATLRGDRIGMMTFGPRCHVVRPRTHEPHALRIIRDLMTPRRTGDHPPGAGVSMLLKTAKTRALVFVVSDLLFDRPIEVFRPLCPRHEVFVMHVSDPLERKLPNVGMVRWRDAETGAVRVIDTRSEAIRRRFVFEAQERERLIRRACARYDMTRIPLATNQPVLASLLRFFGR
jgi:uncharacterized protein (DUF58 family)